MSLASLQSSCLTLPNVGMSNLDLKLRSFTLEKPDLNLSVHRIPLAPFQNPVREISSELPSNSFSVLGKNTHLKSQTQCTQVNPLTQSSRLSRPLPSGFSGLSAVTAEFQFLILQGFQGALDMTTCWPYKRNEKDFQKADTSVANEGQWSGYNQGTFR